MIWLTEVDEHGHDSPVRKRHIGERVVRIARQLVRVSLGGALVDVVLDPPVVLPPDDVEVTVAVLGVGLGRG